MPFSPETDRSNVAGLLCEFQPPLIRRRLYSDEEFSARLGLQARDVLNLGGRVRIDHTTLFKVTRQVLSSRLDQTLSDLSGRPFQIALGPAGIVLTAQSGSTDVWELS